MSCTTCLDLATDPAAPASATCPACGTPRALVTTPDTDAPSRISATSLPAALGRYRLASELGRGGSAIVVRAHDTELDREVALKILPPDPLIRDSRSLRFEREGRALAGVRHPRVVTVHDVGEQDGFLFMAMDLMEGTLAEHLPARDARLSPEEVRRALRWMLQACEGIAALHAQGLIHRDVKPSNLLVGSDGGVAVGDLGIALLPGESTLTLTGHGVGTIAYSAPEQLEGEPATIASDVYGLGATLHALLTGRPPALRGEASLGGLPRGVRSVVRRALAAEPSLRYPTADALAADLSLALRGRGTWRVRATVAAGLVLLAASGVAISWSKKDRLAPAAVVRPMGEDTFSDRDVSLSLRARGHRWEDLIAGGIAEDEQELEIEGVAHRVRLESKADRSRLELHGPKGLLAAQELPSTGAPNERWRLHSSPLDVDGDGFDDTLLKSSSQLLMVKWEPQALGRPELGWRRRLTAPFREGSPAIVDHDGDGKLEVLVGDAPERAGAGELSRPTLHALDFASGTTKQRWTLPTTEFVNSTPQVSRSTDGRLVRAYITTESPSAVVGGKLFGLEPDSRLTEMDLPAGGVGRLTRPLLVDVDGDGHDDLIFSRHDGSITCVPAAEPSRPHWTWRVDRPGSLSVVLSQQDEDPLPEACHAIDFGFQCLNVEPGASSRLEWAAAVQLGVSFGDGGVELPDQNGDGLPEIAFPSSDGTIHVFSRAAPGGLLAVLSLPEGLNVRDTVFTGPVVVPIEGSHSVRVIAMTDLALVACWRVSASAVRLEWTLPTRPWTIAASTSPRLIRWHGQDGRERVGVLVLTEFLHLFELDDAGRARLVWSTWSPSFWGARPGEGMPVVHRDRDGLWVVFTRAPGEVCKLPLRPLDGPLEPIEERWPRR